MREAFARVATNVLRDMNVGVPLADSRRIEMLATGLPLWQGAQVAVDTTLVCPLAMADGCDGTEPPLSEVLADAGAIEPVVPSRLRKPGRA